MTKFILFFDESITDASLGAVNYTSIYEEGEPEEAEASITGKAFLVNCNALNPFVVADDAGARNLNFLLPAMVSFLDKQKEYFASRLTPLNRQITMGDGTDDTLLTLLADGTSVTSENVLVMFTDGSDLIAGIKVSDEFGVEYIDYRKVGFAFSTLNFDEMPLIVS